MAEYLGDFPWDFLMEKYGESMISGHLLAGWHGLVGNQTSSNSYRSQTYVETMLNVIFSVFSTNHCFKMFLFEFRHSDGQYLNDPTAFS